MTTLVDAAKIEQRLRDHNKLTERLIHRRVDPIVASEIAFRLVTALNQTQTKTIIEALT